MALQKCGSALAEKHVMSIKVLASRLITEY